MYYKFLFKILTRLKICDLKQLQIVFEIVFEIEQLKIQ